ncbi:MAG: ATP-binding domain-containing protein [Desulfobacterales bacterium]|nr:ATP-binding domain-containing protein [Desulfobacterales bacterium]
MLAPIYRGPAGVIALNDRLQEKLNPAANSKPERRLFGTTFRLGDKVMQTQNNYDKDVYNGDIGFIDSMDMIEQTLTVDFEGRFATFEWSEADQLTLAYVVSVHKAQGSEFPVVVMPDRDPALHHAAAQPAVHIHHARTKIVRADGQSGGAIGMAVRNNKVAQRFTALEWRLGQGK